MDTHWDPSRVYELDVGVAESVMVTLGPSPLAMYVSYNFVLNFRHSICMYLVQHLPDGVAVNVAVTEPSVFCCSKTITSSRKRLC